jgi:gas vesicle protein
MQKLETNACASSGPLLFLTGMGAGIAMAVLLAPRSGASTRRLIGRKVEEGEEWMKDKAAEAKIYARCQAEKLGDRFKEVAEAIGHN